VPFEGALTDPKIGIWASIKSSLGHAFGQEIPAKTDDTIDIHDAKRMRIDSKKNPESL
jgi:hypothetical protein